MNYWIHRNGENFGPYPIDQLKEHIAQGLIINTDLACAETGDHNWVPISQIVTLPPSQDATPAPALNFPPASTAQATPTTPPIALSSAPADSSWQLGSLGKIGLFLLLTIVGIGFKIYSADQDSDQVKMEAISALKKNTPDWDKNRNYYLELVDEYHSTAFDHAYTQRRRSTEFNADLYAETLLENIKEHVSNEGKTHLSILDVVFEKPD